MIHRWRRVGNSISPWLQGYNLRRKFWLFFVAALCWDAGFGLYLFLFNLYLLDFHFNERAIGLINGALSLGVVVGTLPAGMLLRATGARRLLLLCVLGASILGVIRTFFVGQFTAILLAFIAGAIMCVWTVCFLPVTASLTDESNRGSATGLIFSVGIGASAAGAAASGYLSQFIRAFGSSLGPAEIKRIVLLISSGVVACGLLPLLRLCEMRGESPQRVAFRQQLSLLRNPFLRRFLPGMALWSCLTGVFTPFAAVYFVQQRHISLSHVGLIFSASQIAQLFGGLLVPLVERSLGMLRGMAISQLACGLLLALTVISSNTAWCIVFFCAYSGAQWVCSPAMYTLLMNNVAEGDRAGASALTMFSNFLLTSGATSAMGILLLHFGYPVVMIVIAALQFILAIVFRWSIASRPSVPAATAAVQAGSFTD